MLARFHFDADGRLVLERDEPFLPFGGKRLVLERAPAAPQAGGRSRR